MLGRVSYYFRRMSNRRYLRAERRARCKGDFDSAASIARSSNWTKGGFFTK
jgi:hypothetical protein